MPDPEISAMSTVAEALEALSDSQRQRVVSWAISRFELTGAPAAKLNGGGGDDSVSSGRQGTSEDHRSFEHFAELFAAASPTDARRRALVAGYWVQVHQGKESFGSLELNKELKELGHQSSRINKDLQASIDLRPALVLQLKKSGSTQQGRKTYKLSKEGIKVVEAMLSGAAGDD